MKYEIFRLSLMPNTRPPLLELIETSARPDRQIYLQDELSGQTDFIHRGRIFNFVYVDGFSGRIAARLGRQGYEPASDKPAQKLAPIMEERFQAVNVYIDTSPDPDGQKIAMQHDPRIGSPRAILESLFSHINNRVSDQPYEISIHPIIKEKDFWSVVEAYKSEITSLRIELSAPNVLGLGASIPKEMKKAKEENNVSKATVILENKNNINVDTPDIRETIRYVLAGGDVILRATKKVIFTTRNNNDTVTVLEEQPVSQGKRDMIVAVAHQIFGR